MRLAEMVADFGRAEVVVVGDALVDWWHEGSARSLCREAPAPVVALEATRFAAGGAANAAVNIAALGGRPRFLAVVGADEDGARLTEELRRRGISADDLVVSPEHRTTSKRRLVADGHVLARWDDGLARLTAQTTRALLAGIDRLMGDGAHVLVCDYGLGTLNDEVRDAIARRRHRLATLVVDAHHLTRWAGLRPTVVTPDVEECLTLLGSDAGWDRSKTAAVEEHAGELLRRSGAEAVVATIDEEGAVLLRPGGGTARVEGVAAPRSHTAGAGDTFAAALTLALTSGHDLESSLVVANQAARVVVTDRGTSVCEVEALRAQADGHLRVVDTVELDRLVRRHREAGRSVVFTNGCFDVLHRGHIEYLRQARALGDVLVVGLNSDDSVRRLKGPERPVNSCEDRAAVLAELRCVDLVCVFDEGSPRRLLEIVRPDIYAKGGDYTPEMLAETPLVRDLGGEVRTVDYVRHRSTTELIARIRDNTGAT